MPVPVRSILNLAACIVALFPAAGGASAQGRAPAEIKDINQIIRGLAPIEYLPEHSGKPARRAIDLDIRFAVDKATPLPASGPQLRALGRALGAAELRGSHIEIAGHTDATGTAAHNKALSLRRARSVAGYLQRRFGIAPGRLSVAGHGEERLKDPLRPGHAVNRRVEISVIGTAREMVDVKLAAAKTNAVANGGIEDGAWGDLLENRDGARDFVRRAEAQGRVRVIVTLAAPEAEGARAQGWRNLNDYIHGLQDQAVSTLGWRNINDLVRFDYTPAMAMSVNATRLRRLLRGDVVQQVFVNQMLRANLLQSVTLIGGPPERAGSFRGAGQAVAVLDTGVDAQHPFLKGKVIAEACFSSAGRAGPVVMRSACPSGNRGETGPGAGRPCDPAYGCGHGTHVAGIVAGANGEMSGVAAQASIVAVQVFSLLEGPKRGKFATALTSDILRGLEWVYDNRVRHNIVAVNMSLGGGRFRRPCDQASPLTRIIALLARAGVAVVASSGNDGFGKAMVQPACIEDTVSVGATSLRDRIAAFSNSAGFLDFLAPGATEQPSGQQTAGKGMGILSAIPGSGFRRWAGTSMAAPHVAGAFAVLKGAAPEATLWQMTEALRRTGRMLTDPRNGVGVPRIQLDAAIAALLKTVAGAAPKPEPAPKPAAIRKPEGHDGVRIYGERDGGKAEGIDRGDGEKRIKW
jgi:subtilisin family serine protease/outer membrane protein OmpA-like peptidoglycan-associated protein